MKGKRDNKLTMKQVLRDTAKASDDEENSNRMWNAMAEAMK